MSGDNLTMLSGCVGENVLNKVVTILIAGNVDERDARTINTALADTIKISAQELWPSYLQTLLHDFGGKLIGAVLCGVANDMVNGAASISRGPMFADVLDAPVAKLPMSHDVNVGENLLNARALWYD
jgi:hypothetical protein